MESKCIVHGGLLIRLQKKKSNQMKHLMLRFKNSCFSQQSLPRSKTFSEVAESNTRNPNMHQNIINALHAKAKSSYPSSDIKPTVYTLNNGSEASYCTNLKFTELAVSVT